jgi:tetratricopeptide (TPR) repeat protein
MYAESRTMERDGDLDFAYRLEKMKFQSLAYFKFFIGMQDPERACYQPKPQGTVSNTQDALIALRAHLQNRNDCLFGFIGKARLDTFLQSRPEFIGKTRESPELILAGLFGDSINKDSKRGWERLRAREDFRIVDGIGKDELHSRSDRVLAYRKGAPFITLVELRRFLRHSPLDSGYVDRLADYVEIIGMWKICSQEFASLDLERMPSVEAFVSEKERSFWINAYSTRFFRQEERKSRKSWESRSQGSWEGEMESCREAANGFSPRGYHLAGLLPDRLFQAGLMAGLVSDTSGATDAKCFRNLDKLHADAYEIAKAKLIGELRDKHGGVYRKAQPFLKKLESYPDSLNFAQTELEKGNTHTALEILQSLSLLNFSDRKRLSDISIFLARIAIEAGDFQGAAYHLEKYLLLFPPDDSLEKPLSLLLAVYDKDYTHVERAGYWKEKSALLMANR